MATAQLCRQLYLMYRHPGWAPWTKLLPAFPTRERLQRRPLLGEEVEGRLCFRILDLKCIFEAAVGRARGLRQEDTQETLGSLSSRAGGARKMVPVLTSRDKGDLGRKLAGKEMGHALPSPSLCGREGAQKGQARRPMAAGTHAHLHTWTHLLLSLPAPPLLGPSPVTSPQSLSWPGNNPAGFLQEAPLSCSRGTSALPCELPCPPVLTND